MKMRRTPKGNTSKEYDEVLKWKQNYTLDNQQEANMKKCTCCHEKKPEEEFNWLITGIKRQYRCKACRVIQRQEIKNKRGLTTLQKERKIRNNQDKDAELFNQLNRMWR